MRSDKYWVSKVVAWSGINQKYQSERESAVFLPHSGHIISVFFVCACLIWLFKLPLETLLPQSGHTALGRSFEECMFER